MKFNLIQETENHMTRKRVSLPRPRTFYPSEASITYQDKNGLQRTEGACLRASWYRLTGVGSSEGTSPYSEMIFALGKAVEEILVEQWKQMGIWIDNNVKFYDEERNISGEVDAILVDPEGKLFCAEVKSWYGFMAKKEIMGSKNEVGRPKTSQMMQAMIYVDIGTRYKLWDYVKMVYVARDSGDRAEFDITLVTDSKTGKRYPAVNGVIDYRFTLEDIYARYKKLQDYFEKGITPPRDYDLVYSPEKVEKLHSLDEVSKTAYEKWTKNPGKYPIGDWNCRYCQFCDFCQKDKSGLQQLDLSL